MYSTVHVCWKILDGVQTGVAYEGYLSVPVRDLLHPITGSTRRSHNIKVLYLLLQTKMPSIIPSFQNHYQIGIGYHHPYLLFPDASICKAHVQQQFLLLCHALTQSDSFHFTRSVEPNYFQIEMKNQNSEEKSKFTWARRGDDIFPVVVKMMSCFFYMYL